MLKVKKKKQRPENSLDHLLSGAVSDMCKADKKDFLKTEYETARSTTPDYNKLIEELHKYFVEIPCNIETKNMSQVNEIYARAQSFHSRATAIGMLATDNASRWKRIQTAMEEYIQDKEAALLTQGEISDLRNAKLQQAEVRKRLHKSYKKFSKIRMAAEEAATFAKMVESKKKDLQLVMTTLGKQVKALAVEHDYYKRA